MSHYARGDLWQVRVPSLRATSATAKSLQAVCGLRAALDIEQKNWCLWVNLVLMLLQVWAVDAPTILTLNLTYFSLQIGEVDLAVKTGRKALHVRACLSCSSWPLADTFIFRHSFRH